jgi:uncharacterized protein
MSDLPVSPCIRQCCLNEQNICVGCFRALDEITGWQAAGVVQREAILARCERRKQEHAAAHQSGTASEDK